MTGTSRRRRVPFWLLVLLFVAVPLAEVYVLVQVGQVIGAWWTVLLLLADGVLGSWLMKREGVKAWRALRDALSAGRMPARELADAALVLVGGVLLVTPGFITDALGLLCAVPLTRPLARAVLTRVVTQRLLVGPGGPVGAPGGPQERRRPGPDVVQGEVVDREA
jgi:UPF0716 protein FxsA